MASSGIAWTIATAMLQPASANSTSEAAGWINGLKCSDLVKGDSGDVNQPNLQRFAIWFMGFEAGVSVVPPAGSAQYSSATSQTLAMVLTYCDKNRDMHATEAARDFMSFQYNVLHTDGPAVDLLDPMKPGP